MQTALTHPLDTMRLRLALPNHGYHGEWALQWVCCIPSGGCCNRHMHSSRCLRSPALNSTLPLPTAPHPNPGMADGFATVIRLEGLAALYKGLLPTLVGIAPYAALNFASYDLLKRYVYDAGDR